MGNGGGVLASCIVLPDSETKARPAEAPVHLPQALVVTTVVRAEIGDKMWLVSFREFELGFFDPLIPKVGCLLAARSQDGREGSHA
jgi:hypothetical protein